MAPSTSPVLTVALPLFRAGRIAWLALEGLCRSSIQEPWELLVREESDENAFGPAGFEPFLARLKAAGCAYVRYVSLDAHEALSLKWRAMAKAAAPSSEAFLLQAADDFSHADRLPTTLAHIRAGNDWVCQRRAWFLDINSGATAMYEHPSSHPSGPGIGVRTALLRDLPREVLHRKVDRWLHDHASKAKGFTQLFVKGKEVPACFTHGHHTISQWRGHRITSGTGSFRSTPVRAEHLLPADILERLMPQHQRKLVA